MVTISTQMRNMWHGLARIIQRVPNEIYLKCDDIDCMDNSDMEETDIFMYAKSDPFDPFELAYPTDEREQNDDIIDDCTMEDDLYFLIGSSIVTPLLIADNFNHVVVPPVDSESGLTSPSITATCSSHVTPPPKSGDLTSPSITILVQVVTPPPDATIRSDLFPPTLPHTSFLVSTMTNFNHLNCHYNPFKFNRHSRQCSSLTNYTGQWSDCCYWDFSFIHTILCPITIQPGINKVLSPITQFLTYPSVSSSTPKSA